MPTTTNKETTAMRNFTRLIVLAALTAPATAFALGTSPWTSVQQINHGPGNGPRVELAVPGDAATGCLNNDGGIQFENLTDPRTPGGMRQFDMLLTAMASGLQVQLITDRCSSNGRPLLIAVRVRPIPNGPAVNSRD